MKFPDDTRDLIKRKIMSKHREWLKMSVSGNSPQTDSLKAIWPLEINLGIPKEQDALKQKENVRAWITAWKSWRGSGALAWTERHWRSLGVQTVPQKLILNGPIDAVSWTGEAEAWSRAVERFKTLVQRWPALIDILPRYYSVLANYDDAAFLRITGMLSWICANPGSGLYPRQIPVVGVDSKWLESHKGLICELVSTIQGTNDHDFFKVCGLKPQPQLIRMRILDPEIRNRFSGLCDICVPLKEAADLGIKPTHVFIVENLQTGLAFEDLAGSVVIMALGYGVDVLGQIPWLHHARCIYWGDIDTHGFAILNRARTRLPSMDTVLMDEPTLFAHRDLWVQEKEQSASCELPLLTNREQELFLSLKNNSWGQQIRLEQERICWDFAWKVIQAVHNREC
ncbi:MAG: DUF2220 family protein [Treponema sp.]|nr:DUF2220 family protein [Treponema sp.]